MDTVSFFLKVVGFVVNVVVNGIGLLAIAQYVRREEKRFSPWATFVSVVVSFVFITTIAAFYFFFFH